MFTVRENIQGKSVEEITEYLTQECYPQLFDLLNSMEPCRVFLKKEYDAVVLDTGLMNLYQLLDQQYRLEKIIVFPQLIKRTKRSTTDLSHTSFDRVQQDSKNLVGHLKDLLGDIQNVYLNDDNSYCLSFLNNQLDEFYRLLLAMENIKLKLYSTQEHG
jgi:hypothetical protein